MQFLLSLGDFGFYENWDFSGKEEGIESVREERLNVQIMWFFFFLATFFSQIIVFNMLIAIMGDTYDRVSETKKQYGLRDKISQLSLNLWTFTCEDSTQPRFLF